MYHRGRAKTPALFCTWSLITPRPGQVNEQDIGDWQLSFGKPLGSPVARRLLRFTRTCACCTPVPAVHRPAHSAGRAQAGQAMTECKGVVFLRTPA
jgi:hypothetical protein